MIPAWLVVLLAIAGAAVLVVAVVVAYELGRRSAGARPRLDRLVPLEDTDRLWWQVADVAAAAPTVLPRDVRRSEAPGLYRRVCVPGDPCLRHRANLLDPTGPVSCCGCTQCPNRTT